MKFPLLKLISNSILYPLTLLFNRSLELGQVPYQWKMTNISATFKGKGDDQDPTNYGPISVDSCLGKTLEKIIFKYLYNYLEINKNPNKLIIRLPTRSRSQVSTSPCQRRRVKKLRPNFFFFYRLVTSCSYLGF